MPTPASISAVVRDTTRAPDLRAVLSGSYMLERLIATSDGERYVVRGVSSFSEVSADELVYEERGLLEGGSFSAEITRAYRYSLTGASTAVVRFVDGSHFHELDLSRGRCRVLHRCGDDRYDGTIVVRDFGLISRWRCGGPDKSYVATSRLSRPSGSEGPTPPRT